MVSTLREIVLYLLENGDKFAFFTRYLHHFFKLVRPPVDEGLALKL